MTTLMDLFGQPEWAKRIEKNQEMLMASVADALQGWRDYTDNLKAQLADAEAKLTEAQATVQQLKDTDAAQDAEQAAALTDQIAQQIEDALAAAQNPPEAPPVTEEPVDEAPAEPAEPEAPVEPESPPEESA